MGNTCNIIIVQKHCNMQITNLVFTFDISPPPPKKKNQKKQQQQRNNTQFKLQTLTFEPKIKMAFS